MKKLQLLPLGGGGSSTCLQLLGLAALVTASFIAGSAVCSRRHPLQTQLTMLLELPFRPEDLSAGQRTAEVPQPVLTANELLTLQYYARHARRYLEWGSGGSTILVAPMAGQAWSVDNNKEWCDSLLKDKVSVRFWQANKVINYTCVDTGPTVEWGNPAKGVTKEQKMAYADAIDSLGVEFFDMILIDGRYRVACGLKALWYIKQSSLVMVHDWLDRQTEYGPLLQFYDLEQQADRLAVLRRKPDWDEKAAAAQLDKYYTIAS